jgi:hypothetical protein
VYVSGWGRLNEESCTTDENGPVRNLKCKLPFEVKKKEYRECATVRNPSSQQKECMDFRKANKGGSNSLPYFSVLDLDISP